MISYENIYKYNAPGSGIPAGVGDMHRFRRVDRTGFNVTDNVDLRFFKLLFYFINDDVDNTEVNFFNGGSSGLLAPTWLDNPRDNEYYKYNSAWAFLKSNYEEERADALEKFICLLSQISSESPWYFQSVSGVDEALSREKWQVSEERKKISIKCLNDPVDHRIESLLSLYRSIVWSHARKCEVLPANLRKFDMGMFVFGGLFNGLVVERDKSGNQTNWAKIGHLNINTDRANYKYIEFHNCEISLDSIKSGFGEMSNAEGFEQEFTIDIYFDDCYEHEYNPFIMRSFGDFFVWDAWTNSGIVDNEPQGDTGAANYIHSNMMTNIESRTEQEITERLAYMEYKGTDEPRKISDMGNVATNTSKAVELQTPPSIFDRMGDMASRTAQQSWDQVKGIGKTAVMSGINAATGGLGNIYGKGSGLMGAADAIQQEVTKQVSSLANKVSGNINDTAMKASKSITGAITKPILGTIKAAGTMTSDLVDTTNNIVAKPVLGTLKAAETAVTRTTEVGASYVNEAGEYVSNESKRLGNIAYDEQANFANQIGKNRLEQLNKKKLGTL